MTIGRGFAIASLLIGNGFGGLWLAWAIEALAGPDAPVWPAYAVAAGAFVIAVTRLGRPSGSTHDKRKRQSPIIYLMIVVGEILVLNLIAYELQSHGLLAYLRPAIGLVIGLHFFPLARLFGMPAMAVLGSVMVMAALATFVAMSADAPAAPAIGINALINGVALLATTWVSRGRPNP